MNGVSWYQNPCLNTKYVHSPLKVTRKDSLLVTRITPPSKPYPVVDSNMIHIINQVNESQLVLRSKGRSPSLHDLQHYD